MKLTCSVVRGVAELMTTATALAMLATAGAIWTVMDARRRKPRQTWSDVSGQEDWTL